MERKHLNSFIFFPLLELVQVVDLVHLLVLTLKRYCRILVAHTPSTSVFTRSKTLEVTTLSKKSFFKSVRYIVTDKTRTHARKSFSANSSVNTCNCTYFVPMRKRENQSNTFQMLISNSSANATQFQNIYVYPNMCENLKNQTFSFILGVPSNLT